MVKKSRFVILAASFLCFSTIIGTGYSLWFLDLNTSISDQIHSSSATIETYAESGNLEIIYPTGYENYNIILEQRDSSYSYSDSGVYFTPSISLNYSNYNLPDNCKAKIIGVIAIENSALDSYIKVTGPSSVTDNGDFSYTFLSEYLDTSSKGLISISITPTFAYKDGMNPKASTQYAQMINSINNSYKNDGYLGTVSFRFNVEIEEVNI